MFKFTRKRSSNFKGGKWWCVKGGASRNSKNLGREWAVSARTMRLGWLLLVLLFPAFASAQVNELWVARYHGSVDGSTDRAVAMALDSAGNVYVAGETTPASTSWPRITTIAYDSNGNQLRAVLDQDRNVLQGAPYSTFAHAIVVDSALGHAYVTGGVALIRDGTVEARTVAYD